MITTFSGEYAFLSNFTFAPVTYRNVTYETNEHFFQAGKALKTDDFIEIITAPTAGRAKILGRHVELVPDWEEVKVARMELGLRLKFSQHADLRDKLLETGDEELVEGNTWGDRFWGRVWEPWGLEGENVLGQLLMNLRREYLNR